MVAEVQDYILKIGGVWGERRLNSQRNVTIMAGVRKRLIKLIKLKAVDKKQKKQSLDTLMNMLRCYFSYLLLSITRCLELIVVILGTRWSRFAES